MKHYLVICDGLPDLWFSPTGLQNHHHALKLYACKYFPNWTQVDMREVVPGEFRVEFVDEKQEFCKVVWIREIYE